MKLKKIIELHSNGQKKLALKKLNKNKHMRDIPGYGDHMSIEEFKDCCNTSCFIDSDGFGFYATKTKEYANFDYRVKPSNIKAGIILPIFTHIVWYNN